MKKQKSGISNLKKDPFCEYLSDLSKSAPTTGWTISDDEEYLIHDLLAFRYFSLYLIELIQKNPSKYEQDYNILLFWNEVHDLSEIEDVSCRLVRALLIIETYILSTSKTLIPLPTEHSEALKTYYKKFSIVAEKIKQGGTIRQEDQNKVSDPRPLFTNLQSTLFDGVKKNHWTNFTNSHHYELFKKKEKKELKKTSSESNAIVPPPSSALNRYYHSNNSLSVSVSTSSDSIISSSSSVGSLSSIGSLLESESIDGDIEPEMMRYDPETLNGKLIITRTSFEDVQENWEHRAIFDFYVQRVLKKGRAPAFYYFLLLAKNSNDRKILLQLVKSLSKTSTDIEISEENKQSLNRIEQNSSGVMNSMFSPFEVEFKELVNDILLEIEPKMSTYHIKFLTSRPHALYLHIKSLYSQICGVLIWARNRSIQQNHSDIPEIKKLTQFFLTFFEQFGVDEFYTKQCAKLKRELNELEEKMTLYSTLNIMIQHLFPKIKYHSLTYICAKSPNIRYVISLLKVIVKGLKEQQPQAAVELPFIVKSTLSLGVPVAPVHYVALLEQKNIFSNRQNLGVLTTNCFFQYDHFGATSSKRKISFDTIKTVLFMRDKKGGLAGPQNLGFSIDTGKEVLNFGVPSKKERALWLIAFYSARKTLIPEKIVGWLFEQLEDNTINEDKLLATMSDYCL